MQFFGKGHYLAGLCLEKLGKTSKARERYRRCVAERRHWLPELAYYDYLSYVKLGKPKAARGALRRLAHTIERLEQRPHIRRAFLHHLRSLYLDALGHRGDSEKEARLARRRGWRPSDELQLKFRFGFS